jgi:hypothetical protein
MLGMGTIAEETSCAIIVTANVKKIHAEMTARIDVVVFLNKVENIRLRASQKPTYSMVRNVKAIVPMNSGAVGPKPIIGIAMPVIMPTVLTTISDNAANPARNFPLITASLKIGWESSTDSEPLERSLQIASKPSASPIMGPKSIMKYVNGMPPEPPEKIAVKLD